MNYADEEIKERYTEEEEAEKKSQARRAGLELSGDSKNIRTNTQKKSLPSSKFSSQGMSNSSSFSKAKQSYPSSKKSVSKGGSGETKKIITDPLQSPARDQMHPVNLAAKWDKGVKEIASSPEQKSGGHLDSEEPALEVETIDLGGTQSGMLISGDILASDNDEIDTSHPATVRAAGTIENAFGNMLSKKSISIKRSIKARLHPGHMELAKTPYHSRAGRVLSPSQVSSFLKNMKKTNTRNSRMRNEDLLLSCTQRLLKTEKNDKTPSKLRRVASKSAETKPLRESSATIGSGQKKQSLGSSTLLPQTSARYLQKKVQKRVQLKQNSESSSILGTKMDIKSTRMLDPQKSASPISSRGTAVLSFKTQNPALSCKIRGLEGENAELKEKLIYVEKEREFYRGEIHKIMEKVNEMNERDQLVMEEINLLKKENAFLKEKMNHILRSRSPKNYANNNSSIASTRGTHTPKRQFSESGTASASSLLAAISGNVSGASGGNNNSIVKPTACHSSSSSIVAQNSFHNSRNKYRALGQRRSTSLIKANNLTRTDKVKNVLATQSIESFSAKINLNSTGGGSGHRVLNSGGAESERGVASSVR